MERGPAPVTAGRVATVAILAPSGYDPDDTRLRRATRYFEARGAQVVCALDPAARDGRLAGTDDERLGWLGRVVADPTIDVAVALRGGYGLTRLLPRLDFDAMAAAVDGGLRLVGHSDFTALSLGLFARTQAPSFAGPMAGPNFGVDAVDADTEACFWSAIRDGLVDLAFETTCATDVAAAGPLWGGNLAMLASLVGTPWMPVVDGGVLFVEDVNEQPYRIERMLLQLVQAGIVGRQALVLVGDFCGWRPTDYDRGYDLAAAIARVRRETAVPIVDGLPFGHGARIATLAVGVEASVRVAGGRVRLVQTIRGRA